VIDEGEEKEGWECLQCKASELSPEMSKHMSLSYVALKCSHISLKQTFQLLLRPGGQAGPPNEAWANEVLHDLWWSIVARYTSSQLTRQEDRWVAISGLAQLVQQASGRTLLAGL
jgi:hypothetical protein